MIAQLLMSSVTQEDDQKSDEESSQGTATRSVEEAVGQTGFIDHIGIAVPNLQAAKDYYDELMPILGLKEWFKTSPEFNYGPDGALGTQLFFYQAQEPGNYSRNATGLHHIAFAVEARSIVHEAHQWACSQRAMILHAPRDFPEYGIHYATYWLDPHGIKLEVVCHSESDDTQLSSERP